MEKTSTQKKNRTRLTHLTWLTMLVASIVLFATCYEWTIDQPTEGFTNSSITVSVVLKPSENGNFAAQLENFGVFGVLLPEGWTVEDSIFFSTEGVNQDEPVEPYRDTGWIVYDAEYAQMYEDSAVIDYESRQIEGWTQGDNIRNYTTPEGYYWWGGKSTNTARVANLDSISLTVTIHTDDQTGDFNLQYAMGTLDWWVRTPVVEGGVSELMPITISDNTNVKNYLEGGINVYPNPASNVLHVDAGSISDGEILLLDMTGRVQFRQKLTSRIHTFDISDYATGAYVVKLKTDLGEYSRKVLIK